MKYLLVATAALLTACDKFEGAALDAKKLGENIVEEITISQSQRDAEAACAARINSGQPRPNRAGHPVTYPTVNPPQFRTKVLGYNKYHVQTLLDVPNALVPFIAECIVESGKITGLLSD